MPEQTEPSLSPMTQSPRSQSPRIPAQTDPVPSLLHLRKGITYSPLKMEQKPIGSSIENVDEKGGNAKHMESGPVEMQSGTHGFPFQQIDGMAGHGPTGHTLQRLKSKTTDDTSSRHTNCLLNNTQLRRASEGNNGQQASAPDTRKNSTFAGNSTPPARRSVQFLRPALNIEQRDTSQLRSGSWDAEEGENPSKDRRGGSLFSKLRALASQSSPQTHVRSPSGFTVGGDSIDERTLATTFSPDSGRDEIFGGTLDEEGGEEDADAEQSTGEDNSEPYIRKKRRKSRRPQDGGPQTAPTTPKTPFLRDIRPGLFSSNSLSMNDGARHTFLARRATMTDLPEETRQGVSEDEGRDRLGHESPWRRGSAWASRGLSYGGTRKSNQQAANDGRRPSNFRRMTGLGSSGEAPEGSPFSPWKIHRADRSSSLSAAKWRQLKAGLRMIGQRRKAENTIDHVKSAELMAELTAATPAALILASMFQRDEHGNRRIPILLEQVKIRLTDSRQVDSKSGDRHMVFRIELEYGNGLTRMKWVIHRALRDFANLHARYKLQIGAQKYIQLKADDARTKLPHFPRSTFPYMRGIRGLDSDSEDEEEPDADATGPSGGEASGTEKAGKRKKRRSSANASRGKSAAASPQEGDVLRIAAAAGGFAAGATGAPARKEHYPERQRKKLELYLQKMIRFLIFRPESNRICKFLELSALGVRLAAEGSYHGKEGLLVIQSGKGVDFRRAWVPSLIKSRHGPKWFLVRHSYVVCVDSPEEMNIYDVFLVDSAFDIQNKKKRLRDQKPKDLARTARESASHPQHHSLRLRNSERKLKLLAKNERQLHQFEESIRFMSQNTPWAQVNRFESFAPVRSNVFAQWLVDGRDYMWNVSRAISMAKDVIYIHDWWLSPELYMRRPAAISQKWRLDRLLQRKAREGVKIFVIVYRNIQSAIPIDSEYTKFSLLDLHANIFVQRSPNQIRQNTFFWAHHEKICVVDHMVAFVGGIDLCFGRWDTPQHSVADDKLTGFELSEMPKDADHCQLWPGKDYSNPRTQDFYELDKPYEEMYDRTNTPRMPWHDISMQIVGQPARDLTRHFVQRWNFILRQRKPTRPTPFLLPPPDFNPADLEALGLNGTCEVQILRSCSSWSMGTPDKIEHSIMNAYIKMIEQSEYFVYIENQFFISSTNIEGTRIENLIGDALVERIIRASQKDEAWQAIIVIPLMPGFQSEVDVADGTSIRLIMQCQYRSICRTEASIFSRLRAQGIEPEDYIQFYSLRSWGKIGTTKQLVTEQLYIHAKCMVVDDRIAIIGSANINERSMLGNRDSECAAVVRDTDMLWSTMNGEPYLVGRFPHTLRMRLMREHLGIDVDEVMDGELQEGAEKAGEQWEREMDEFHAEKVSSNPSNSDQETERRLLDSKHKLRDDLVAKSEELLSFNHDIDWEEANNPNLKANKKLTEDARVTGNETHRRDVDGDGADNMKQGEQTGSPQGRDTALLNDKRETLTSSGGMERKSTRSTHRKTASPQRSQPRDKEDLGSTLPPLPKFPRMTTAQLGLPMLSQLPPLPNVDDTDIGGPSIQRSFSQKTAEILDPLLSDIKRPFVDKDCMRDPLNNSFFLDTWHAIAENNTRLFRTVFRCMPDSEVRTWKEYKEYAAYSERFAQAQGGGKNKDRAVHPEVHSSSGPPGQVSTTEKLHMAGLVGEKLGDVGSTAETFSEKFKHHLPGLTHTHTNTGTTAHIAGNAEEWAEDANKAHLNQEKEASVEKARNAEAAFDEKADLRNTNDANKGFAPLDARSSHDPEKLRKAYTASTVTYSDAINLNTNMHKRRRRATTRSSRREFRASDEMISPADALELLNLVQGHLVVWPYDW
ncbi:Phospholipase D1 [Toensbergia leucococca]|nr:Phospholipase D1 [Toensbergia leucococca]